MPQPEPMTLLEFPEIPGYISVARTAKIFGFSKASIYYKIYTQRAFQHVYRLGGAGEGTRPVLLLLESEVRAVKAAEDAAAAVVPFKDRLNAWHKRVKEWGKAQPQLFSGPIHTAGQPHLDLQTLYLDHHPGDPRPTE